MKREEISKYEKIYGKTEPVMAIMMYPLVKNHCLVSYNGCQIREGDIIFSFSTKLKPDQFNKIEDIFRNRLGRKCSFMISDYEFKVLVNPQDKADIVEYFIAAQILDLYYRGKEQSEVRIAEYAAYRNDEDWRDELVVHRYLNALWKARSTGENWRDINVLYRYL